MEEERDERGFRVIDTLIYQVHCGKVQLWALTAGLGCAP